MARHDGDLESAITAFADNPQEMRDVIKHHAGLNVDNIKLVMSGEEASLATPPLCCFYANHNTDLRSPISSRLLLQRRGDCSLC
jgi:hypothetical protein